MYFCLFCAAPPQLGCGCPFFVPIAPLFPLVGQPLPTLRPEVSAWRVEACASFSQVWGPNSQFLIVPLRHVPSAWILFPAFDPPTNPNFFIAQPHEPVPLCPPRVQCFFAFHWDWFPWFWASIFYLKAKVARSPVSSPEVTGTLLTVLSCC